MAVLAAADCRLVLLLSVIGFHEIGIWVGGWVGLGRGLGGSGGKGASRRRLSGGGGFDLHRRPLLLPPGVLADERAVLVELRVLVAVVHQAVAAVRRFDLPAQRASAALQRLLIVVAVREEVSERERERERRPNQG